MLLNQIIRSGPNQYICQEGILHEMAQLLQPFRSPFILSGQKSYEAYSKYTDNATSMPFYEHKGHCSDEAVKKIATHAKNADVIIGIGGGVILDTAKTLADELDIEVVLIPTVIGTCAASTPLSVMYDEQGAFVRVAYHQRSAYMTLIDPLLLLQSPVDYLKSGIADTLAKWYEAEALIRNTMNGQPTPLLVKTALQHAETLKNLLLAESEQAIEQLNSGNAGWAFTNICEGVIMVAGTVGGYGGIYGRIAGAHAVHNGLSFVPETQDILHGQKVAYGILVQLILEECLQEVKKLLPFYKKLDLPVNFSDLHITNNKETAMQKIAAHAVKKTESLVLLGNYSEADCIAAMEKLESLQ